MSSLSDLTVLSIAASQRADEDLHTRLAMQNDSLNNLETKVSQLSKRVRSLEQTNSRLQAAVSHLSAQAAVTNPSKRSIIAISGLLNPPLQAKRRKLNTKSNTKVAPPSPNTTKKQKLNTLNDQLKSYMCDALYVEAAQLIKQILTIDPTNTHALIARDLLKKIN